MSDGAANYYYNDAGGTGRDTGLSYTSTGLHVDFTMTSATNYSVTIRKLTGGTTVTLTGGPISARSVQQVRFWNFNAGAGNNVYFNNLAVGPGADDNAGNYSSWSGDLGQKALTNGPSGIASSGYTGATSSSLSLTNTWTGDSGAQFDCVVYNSIGSATSSAATSTVNTSATITSQPASQSRTVGNNVTFTVATTGGSPTTTYQWQKNGVNIGGANSASYTIGNVQTTDAANASGYSCVVSNGTCFQSSSAATLAVNVVPTISGGGQPANATICSGNTVSFTNTPATGASTACYDVVVSASGTPSVTSSAATVTVNPTPTASNVTYNETRGLTFTLNVSVW